MNRSVDNLAIASNWTYIKVVNIFSYQLSVFVGWEWIISTFEGNGPVDQEEVNIFQTQIIQALLQCLTNIIRMVLVVPQLCRNKDLAPGYAALLYGFADSRLSTVAMRVSLVMCVESSRSLPSCRVNMAISCLEGYKDCCLLGSLILPGSQANGRNLRTSGEFKGFLSVGSHCRTSDE